MKQLIKKYIQIHFKDFYYWQQSYRFRLQTRKKFWNFQNKISKDLYPNKNIEVLQGPFKGMKYINKVVWGPITPKWIGCYEEELHEIVNQIIEKRYKIIIDIGAAEGYYAVGLARSCKKSFVYSFDIDPFARKLQHELAFLNAATNLTIGKYCSHSSLDSLIQSQNKNLIICDIEGFEYHLLDPEIVDKLKFADILVEVHPFDQAGKSIDISQMTSILKDRFILTHQFSEVGVERRRLSKYSALEKKMSVSDAEEAVNEYRYMDQKWLWFKRKS